MSDYKFVFSVLRKSLLASALLLVIAPGAPVNAAESGNVTTTSKTTRTVRRTHDAAKSDKKTTDGKAGAASTANEEVAADNTATNKRDRADRAVTADQQKNDKSDVELAAEIRRAIIDDKSLSINAHNVKIIVVDGKVTLKGPVASQAEKVTVEKLAGQHAGQGKGRVTSEIEVAP